MFLWRFIILCCFLEVKLDILLGMSKVIQVAKAEITHRDEKEFLLKESSSVSFVVCKV